MYVEYETDTPPPREHPWTVSEAVPDGRFWDFKTSPEQIPLVLEDFKPWSHYPAILGFYDLLRWLNGSDSIFETNDCGLRPPRPDSETPEFLRHLFANDPIVVHGRLTLLFRDLAWNVSEPTVDGLIKSIHDGLRNNVSLFPAVVMVGDWHHFFTAINKPGRAVSLRFWSWGDDEEMAMGHLHSTFNAILGCLQWISNGVKAQNSKA